MDVNKVENLILYGRSQRFCPACGELIERRNGMATCPACQTPPAKL